MKRIFFLFEERMFRFRDISTLLFLVDPQTTKSLMSSQTLLFIKSYTFDCFYRILYSSKMKFDPKLVQIMANVSNLFLALRLKLVPDHLTILIK